MLFPLPHYLTADEASAKATISSIASVKTGLFLDKILDHSLLQQIYHRSIMSATGTLTTKRTRFTSDETQELPSTTPLEAAKCVGISALTAIGSLQEPQTTFFLELQSEFLKLQKALENLNERKSQLQQAGKFASSTKFKFEPTASARLLEDDTVGFEAIKTQCKSIVMHMQINLNSELVKLLVLEIKSVKKAIQNCIAKSIVSIASTLALSDPTFTDKSKAGEIYQLTYGSAGIGGLPILKHSEFESAYDIYDKIHEMATEHTPTEAAMTAYRPVMDHAFCVTATSPIVKTFNTITKALFVDSWNTYLEQTTARNNLVRVKQFISLVRATTATTTTAMDVDNIDITNTQSVATHIDKCVRTETKKQTKNLEKEIQILKRVIAKNTSRGAKLPSASHKKKTGSKRPTVAAVKAAGADAASSKPKPNLGKKSQKKGKNSRNKKRN